MSTSEQKNLIERAIIFLRQRIAARQEPKCTIEDIIASFAPEERRDYQFYTHPGFLNSFYEAVKNNPKIHFDLKRRQFTFKNKFLDIGDFLEKLYKEKRGVREDDDLYDDLDKDQIQKLKNGGLLRELVIKEKKTKNPITVLFAKNYANDEMDALKFEAKSSEYLKNYWDSIEKEAIEMEKVQKYSNITFLNRNQRIPMKLKLNKQRKKKEELNVYSWKNVHLAERIQQALKKMDEFVEITNKNRIKRIKLK